MRASSFAVLFALSALPAVAAGCGHRGALPPQQPQSGMAEYIRTLPVPDASSTPRYGTGISVYSGGDAGGPFLYAMCNKKLVAAPATPSPDCFNYVKILGGVRSLSESPSGSANPCQAAAGGGSCSTSAAVSAAQGKLSFTLSDSTAPAAPSDPSITSEGLAASEMWQDTMRVSSASLPAGTAVTIQATMKIGGTFNVPCGLAANASAGPVYLVESEISLAALRGACVNGKLQKTVLQADGTTTTGTAWTGQMHAYVGQAVSINGLLSSSVNIQDCTQAWNASPCAKGAAAGSMQPLARFYFAPVTAGVTLTYASGHSYLPPSP